jgi:nitrogen fixation/metabolism regulation signal transduction histidine kinase
MSRRLRGLTIPTRIFLSFALVLVAFATVSGFSVAQHQRSASDLRLLHEGFLPVALLAGEAKADQSVFLTMLDRVLQERDSTASRDWLTAARRVRPGRLREARSRLTTAERLVQEEADRAALAVVRENLDAIEDRFRAGDAAYPDLFEAVEQGRLEDARETLNGIRRDEQEVARRFRASWTLVQRRIAATSAEAAAEERRSIALLAGLALLALLAGLGVTLWSQRLLAPLPRLTARVLAVAKGDFAPRLVATRDDEIGRLTTEFEAMVDAVGARDRQLRDAAETLRGLQRMQEEIVAGLRAAVLVLDGDGTVRSVNPAAAKVLGLAEAGVRLSETGLPERLPALDAAIADVADGAGRAALEAVPFAVEEGERRLDVLVSPFGPEPEAAERRSVLVVADDVTEELHTKARLIRTERLAAIGRMAAHVTHEVRNPLSSIGLNFELLEEELDGADAETKALLRAIGAEIDRLTALTEEYLRLARLPAPRLQPEHLGHLVEEVGGFVTREMAHQSVDLEVRVAEDLPAVAADEAQMRQALLNLLRNAREAMEEGGTILLSARSTAGGGVEVEVADRGAGISAEAREHIFDLFYSTKETGTGLGLPLTQQIVAAHGGTIRCEDREGGGTRFVLTFPALAQGAARPSAA